MQGLSARYRIRDLAPTERPREKMVKYGADKLEDEELIAILIRVGVQGENAVDVGKRLLDHFRGLRGIYNAPIDELKAQRGIGEVKAIQIKAAIELGRRLSSVPRDQNPIIQSPADAAAIVKYEMSNLPEENLWVLNLDVRNRLIDCEKLYKGSLNGSSVRVGELFKAAIHKGASGIIILHNHPSGDPSPSPEDVSLTRAVVAAGKLLDIEVVDHLVIGQGRFVSMKERGLGFN